MAYADQQAMSSNRIISIVVVLLLHAFLGYALVTGLAYQGIQAIAKKMNVIDVKEEKPPEEEPPPPDEVEIKPPPVTAPEPPFKMPSPNPIQAQTPIQQPVIDPNAGRKPVEATGVTCWDGSTAPSLAACPAKPVVPKRPKPIPRGNPGNWANANDYPSRDLQQENQGTTSFQVTVGPDGRVQSCTVTASSGFSSLDDVACRKISARARFEPALDGNGNPTTGTYSNRVRWVVPKE
jgi:periplasmic protein TonB